MAGPVWSVPPESRVSCGRFPSGASGTLQGVSYKVRNRPRRGRPDLGHAVLAVEMQRERCARGEHDPSGVPADRGVYAPGGRRRHVAEKYCRCCGRTLAADPDKRPRTGGNRPGPDTEEGSLDASEP